MINSFPILQVHNPSWMHHQSYLMQPTVGLPLKQHIIHQLSAPNIWNSSHFLCGISTGNARNTYHGSHSVHPACCHDATDPAAESSFPGQHGHGESLTPWHSSPAIGCFMISHVLYHSMLLNSQFWSIQKVFRFYSSSSDSRSNSKTNLRFILMQLLCSYLTYCTIVGEAFCKETFIDHLWRELLKQILCESL